MKAPKGADEQGQVSTRTVGSRPMTECPAESTLLDYLEGQLPPAERDRWREMVKGVLRKSGAAIDWPRLSPG